MTLHLVIALQEDCASRPAVTQREAETLTIISCIPANLALYWVDSIGSPGMIFDQSVVCPVFIGRQNDLQLLDRLMMQLGGNNAQIALISGEAGIGKSRLVKEAKARAPEGTEILEGHCFQTEAALPYAPRLDLFQNFFATHSSAEIAIAMASSAPQLVKLFPELTVHLPDLTPAPSPSSKALWSLRTEP